MSPVSFEFVTRTSEVEEKNVPVLHVKIPTRGASDSDVVVRKATDEDKEKFKDEYAEFLKSQEASPVPPEAAPEAPKE